MDMAGASKECLQEQKPKLKHTGGSSIMDIMIMVVKKVTVVGIVYLAGYMNWSVAWFFGPIILSVMREHWRKEGDLRRSISKAAAMANEKDVILARLDDLPAWVYFPDVERAEWLNKILRQVWPNVNHYTRDLIKDSIQPSVQKSLANYKLQGFKFERLILGTIPPRIGGVKVYDKHVSRNEIIMDIDLIYAGDCDISFTLSGIKGGIKDLQLHGMVRVVMKPLIKSMPLVGGLQVFFLNNPDIDFNLVGVADVLDMPGLSELLRRVIVEQVAAMMVLPNKFPIKLSDEVEAHILKMPEPEGVLRVHVVEAKHLMKMDIGMLGKGKSDPYAVITVGAQEFRTKTIVNTVNPKWDFWCESPVLESSGQAIFLHVWDKDDGPRDDESLGRATIEVSNVVKNGEVDTWITLEKVKHGMVHLRLTWFKLTTDISDLKSALAETQLLRLNDMSSALLTVFIDSARNLPQARVQSKPDPYVVATVAKRSQQTAVQMRTDSPVWEQGYTFLVPNPETDSLVLKVLDNKTNSEIGEFIYNLTGLLEKKNMEIEKEPFTLHRSGPESKIIVSISLRILKLEAKEVIDSNVEDNEECTNDKPLMRTDSTKSTASIVTVSSTPSHKSDSVRHIHGLDESDEMIEVSQDNNDKNSIEETIESSKERTLQATPSFNDEEMTIHHRTPSTSSSAGEAGLGRIQLTLRYSVQRQKLIIVVHKIVNLPMRDPSNIPDPYVKLYLLPNRLKETKRKTHVVKDNCNPVYDESFEYVLSQGEMNMYNLEVTVVTQKSIFSSASNVMGQVVIHLGKSDLSQALTSWFDLQPEANE